MRRASSMPRERRADPRQEQRERTAELKREKAARQFLLNHRLRHALAPRTGEKLDLLVSHPTAPTHGSIPWARAWVAPRGA